ncbi:MAG: exodeoxyribonuclease V subunit gamma [Pseudohongiellaceae bacterium]|nr:exodeoxyribonuclease V subunit gamma [Pseudohongiellaceae bacterium]
MPLHLLSSNRVELLQHELARLLLSHPLSSVFTSETVLVPSTAMQRWLNLQLAQNQGVAANIEYYLPANWVWQVAVPPNEQGNKAIDPLSREHMSWQILELLPELLEREEFTPLQAYLKQELDGVKAWQLSQKIADVFDRYQFYRPDWIRSWSAGDAGSSELYPAWQPILWQALLSKQNRPHRVEIIDGFLQAISAAEPEPAVLAQLPERINCFALSGVPPLFMDVLSGISKFSEVYLFQHSPSDQYWADLSSKTRIARQRIAKPEEHAYYDTGNEILASWGRQGQAFQDLLLSHDALESEQVEAFSAPGKDTLLHRLQQSILELSDEKESIDVDDSIDIRICHSPLRECQVLHDSLLYEFSKDSSLKPEDVLVIVPEISRYAPYIEAVFRKREDELTAFIPWNLSDITVADQHPLIQVFFTLLALPSSRFTYSEVLSYLEVPEIANRFGLGADDVVELTALLQDCEVRWGIDGQHKTEFGLPATEHNTWRAAIARLWSGYALAETPLWGNIAPLDNMGAQEGVVLGRFCAFFETLVRWRKALAASRAGAQWQHDIAQLLQELFVPTSEDDDRIQQIRDVLVELGLYAEEQDLSHSVLQTFLQEKLGTQAVNSRYFSGGVSFCGMRPMRSLPFRHVCVLGLQDQAFPRRESPLAFDAMAAKLRLGDPLKADEDRYLLLETLLCTRDKLYISYVGRSLKDNSDCQPSVLLRELCDYLDERYSPKEAERPLSQCISAVMPMQPFSERNFSEVIGAKYRSFDQWWAKLAQQLLARKPQQEQASIWPEQALPLDDQDFSVIDLETLSRFFDHPIKAFFQSRLRVYLQDEDELVDDEVFALSSLEQWSVNKAILDAFVTSLDSQEELQQLQKVLVAKGQLPHGERSTLAFDASLDKMAVQTEKLEEFRDKQAQSVEVESFFNAKEPGKVELPHDIRLTAQCSHYFPGFGLLIYTPSKLKAKPFLRAWLEHLVLCSASALKGSEVTRLICLDGDISLPIIEASKAKSELRELLQLYIEGQSRPLAIFPKSSFTYAKSGFNPTVSLRNEWEGVWSSPVPGERDDVYIKLAKPSEHYHPGQCSLFQQTSERLYRLAFKQEVLPK